MEIKPISFFEQAKIKRVSVGNLMKLQWLIAALCWKGPTTWVFAYDYDLERPTILAGQNSDYVISDVTIAKQEVKFYH